MNPLERTLENLQPRQWIPIKTIPYYDRQLQLAVRNPIWEITLQNGSLDQPVLVRKHHELWLLHTAPNFNLNTHIRSLTDHNLRASGFVFIHSSDTHDYYRNEGSFFKGRKRRCSKTS